MNARIQAIRIEADRQFSLLYQSAALTAQQDFEKLYQEVMLISGYLDNLLLETPRYHTSTCIIWGADVKLVRFNEMKHAVVIGNRIWHSITQFANDMAEYAVKSGYV